MSGAPVRTLAIAYGDELTVECDVSNNHTFDDLFRLAVDALAPWHAQIAREAAITASNFSVFVEFSDQTKEPEDMSRMTLFPYAIDKMHARKGTAISYRFKRKSAAVPETHDSSGDLTSALTTAQQIAADEDDAAVAAASFDTDDYATDDATADDDDDGATSDESASAALPAAAAAAAATAAASATPATPSAAAGSMSDASNDLTWDEVDGRKRIMTGTLRGLVRALADQDVQDKDFLDVFVMTYRFFTTGPALLDELASRFDLQPPPGQAADDNFARAKSFVQMRVVNVLKKWVKCHFLDVAASDETRQALAATLARMAAVTSDASRGFLRQAAQTFDEMWREHCEQRGLPTPLESILQLDLESPRGSNSAAAAAAGGATAATPAGASATGLVRSLELAKDRPTVLAPPSPRVVPRSPAPDSPRTARPSGPAPLSPRTTARPSGVAPSSPRLSGVSGESLASNLVLDSPPRRKRRSNITTSSGASLGRQSPKGSPLIGGAGSNGGGHAALVRRRSAQTMNNGGELADDGHEGSYETSSLRSTDDSDLDDSASTSPASPARAPNADTSARCSIDDFSATQLAHQMTLDEFRIFARIEPTRELSLKTWEKRPEDAPNIAALIDRVNDISWWTATEVIMKPTPKQRVDVVCKMIDVAQVLRDLNNFNGLMEVTSGLNLSVVTRLKQLWESVPKKKVEQLRALSELMSPLGGYAGYRRELAKVDGASGGSNCSAIPFQGVYLSNLIAIDENPNVLANGHVNFAKMWMVGRIFRSIVGFQRIPYDQLQPDENVAKFFRSIAKLNDDELWQLSLKLQPRSSTTDEPPSPAKDSFAKRLLTTRPRRNSLLGKAKKTDLATQLADIDQSNEDEGVKELRKQMAMRDTPTSRLAKSESSSRVRSNSVNSLTPQLPRSQSVSHAQNK